MRIFRAIGLGIAIIVLKFLAPRIFAGIENTLLAFFDAIQRILAADSNLLPANLPSMTGF